MAITKDILIVTKTQGVEKAIKEQDKLATSIKRVENTTKTGTKAFKESGNAILENGGAMGLLNDATGGVAMTIKDAVEATSLFTSGTVIATGAQKLYTLVVGTTTGALKALRLALVSTGIGALVVVLGVLVAKLMESAEATDEQKRQQDLLNESIDKTNTLYNENIKAIEDVGKVRKLRAEIAGKSEKDLAKIEKETQAERYKAYIAERDRLYGELDNKKLNAEGIKKVNDALAKNQKEYFDYIAGLEVSDLEKQKENKEKSDALRQKQIDENKAKALEEKKQKEEELKKQLEFEESVRNGQLGLESATNLARVENEKALEQDKLDRAVKLNAELDKIEEDRTKLDEEEQKRRLLFAENVATARVGLVQNTENLIGALAKKGSAVAKGLAIANIVRDQVASVSKTISATVEANAKAVALSPLTSGQPFVTLNTIQAGIGIAGSVAGALKSIKDINSESKSPSGGGGGNSGGGGGSAPAPAFNLVQGTGSNQIAQSVGSQNRPIQAFVVASNVTTAQEMDRNIVQNATI